MTAREKAKKMQIYSAGAMARYLGQPANPPGDLSWEDRHWWLGGYSDRDSEMSGNISSRCDKLMGEVND